MTLDDLSLPEIFAGLRDGRLDRPAVQAWARALARYPSARPCDEEALYALTVAAVRIRGAWFLDEAALSLWIDLLGQHPLEWPLSDGWVSAPHTPWPERSAVLVGHFEALRPVSAALGPPVRSWWDLDTYEVWCVRAPGGQRLGLHRFVPSFGDADPGEWFELTACREDWALPEPALREAALRLLDARCPLAVPAVPHQGAAVAPEWALWRTDGSGLDFRVSAHLTEAAAERERDRRSRTVHQQWFWTAPARSGKR